MDLILANKKRFLRKAVPDGSFHNYKE